MRISWKHIIWLSINLALFVLGISLIHYFKHNSFAIIGGILVLGLAIALTLGFWLDLIEYN